MNSDQVKSPFSNKCTIAWKSLSELSTQYFNNSSLFILPVLWPEGHCFINHEAQKDLCKGLSPGSST